MWKYAENNCCETISLHDCRVNAISQENNSIVFNFYDGFWLLPKHELNPKTVPVRTGRAQLLMEGCDDQVLDRIVLFKRLSFLGRTVLTYTKEINQQQLAEMLNGGGYQLEFLWQYRQGTNQMHQCVLWGKSGRNYWTECQLFLTALSCEYRWNEILLDREW